MSNIAINTLFLAEVERSTRYAVPLYIATVLTTLERWNIFPDRYIPKHINI